MDVLSMSIDLLWFIIAQGILFFKSIRTSPHFFLKESREVLC